MSPPDNFLLVGIGASAGGIEALEGFFQGVPDELDAAFIIATHLSPERPSLLHEVVARFTSRDVSVATHGEAVESGHVYVLPEAATISVVRGRIVLHDVTPPRERKPVDVLLASLAVDAGERAAGVILSGGDNDGTLGLKAIKEHGGITMAQVPDGFGPRHRGMPDSAILAGFADFPLPADQMGAKLLELHRDSPGLDMPRGPDDESVQALPRRLKEVYALLRGQVGHDFSGYKTKTFVRRVQRRMQVTQIDSLEAYIARLHADTQEVGALFRDLLINVTNFFRDAEAFDALADQVVPELFADKTAGDTVRVWVPGCATGEEVYSLAILMREYMDGLLAPPRVQIFATDIDDRALAVARAARYPEPLMESVSAERRSRFFTRDSDAWVVAKGVRDLCIFSPHSVIRDPPFSRIDLVSCRNLLIYFGADVQNQVIPVFHYALRPGGFLFLGSAENVTQFTHLFEPAQKRYRIFRRRSDGAPKLSLPAAMEKSHGHVGDVASRRAAVTGMALRSAVDRQVLDRFSPPHVVVNRDGDVVYYSSRTGKYLEPPAGAPTRQLQTMARRELRLDLRTLFRECVETGRPTSRSGIAIDLDDGRVQLLAVNVEPLYDSADGEPLYLVLFIDQAIAADRDQAFGHTGATGDRSARMEGELRETRDRLQSMIEEYETALEELKSSNEELVSVNEEMQSTNEELEASKEELQSVNEELHTVNAELHGKIDALDRANSDLVNLFDSTNVATVFLDRDLVIRTYTPAVTRIFNIRGSDRGRPITDLSSQLAIPLLFEDIAAVFETHAPIERRAATEDGQFHYSVRLAPYHSGNTRVEGVVVSFLDVTSLTLSEARQRMLVSELQHRTRNLLTIVQTIARRTLHDATGLDDFGMRLAALSRVQSLVGGELQEAIELDSLVRQEMEAHSIAPSRVSIDGPRVELGYDVAQTLSLALHELTTNAVKYGAFRGEQGRLSVRWQRDSGPADVLSLTWKESGVSVPSRSPGSGFGRELTEKALAFTLRATSSWQIDDDGVLCQIAVPLQNRGLRSSSK